MKTTMRRDTFETNSSSTHTLILVPYDVADRWRSLGEDYWLDMALVESDAEESGSGYGDIDWIQAPAEERHLVSKSAQEMLGEWNNEPAPYQDAIDLNWKLPLRVIDDPSYYVDDSWCSVYSVKETDEGYVIEME